MNTCFTALRVTAVCFSICLLSTNAVHANPTGEKPGQALAAHGTIEAAKGMVTSLYEIYEEEAEFVGQTFALRDTPEKLAYKPLAKSAGRLWKARRDAEHLKLMCEPAGFDLAAKFDMLIAQIDNRGQIHLRTPPGTQANQRVKQKLQREKPGLTRFLQQAAAALQKGRLELVEKQLEAKGIELQGDANIIHYMKKNPWVGEFNSVMSQTDSLLRKQRAEQYRKQAQQKIQEQLAAVAEFSSEAARIADEIARSGSAKIGEDKTATAPQALAHVATMWGHASASLMRANAIHWAFSGRYGSGDYGGGGSGPTASELKPDAGQLKQVALRTLSSIIEAAAASTPPEKVQSVYSDLLKQVSVVDRRSGSSLDPDVSKACQAALTRLAEKDPDLSARIAAYRRATSEALNWRQQFAEQQARHLSANVSAAPALLSSASPVTSSRRPDWAPKPGETTIAAAKFDAPAKWMVQEAGTRLVGKPVTEKNMIRLTPTSRTAVVPMSSNHYANIPVASLSADDEVADLTTALVIDDDHGPLTIESADAISAAELKDFQTVAGVIQQVHLEAAVTRLIGLPDVAYPLQPLGRMPQFSHPAPPVVQTCWRLDITPAWAQHRYFTVRQRSAAK